MNLIAQRSAVGDERVGILRIALETICNATIVALGNEQMVGSPNKYGMSEWTVGIAVD